jgi:Down syndrome cell adhesion protein 1
LNVYKRLKFVVFLKNNRKFLSAAFVCFAMSAWVLFHIDTTNSRRNLYTNLFLAVLTRQELFDDLKARASSVLGMDDEICPYATFHLLGFREEMDPSKAMQFQTFPHPHAGTMGPSGMNTPHQMHSRTGSQSMPRQNRRYDRVGSQGNGSIYSPGPEYDDPANCAPEDEQYGSQYGGYGAPYDQYGSRGSIGRRSLGSLRLQPTNSSPEPPPPPPRNHDPSFNDSKDSNEISEAECDRDQLINSRAYGETKQAKQTGDSQPTILWQCNL